MNNIHSHKYVYGIAKEYQYKHAIVTSEKCNIYEMQCPLIRWEPIKNNLLSTLTVTTQLVDTKVILALICFSYY